MPVIGQQALPVARPCSKTLSSRVMTQEEYPNFLDREGPTRPGIYADGITMTITPSRRSALPSSRNLLQSPALYYREYVAP